MSSEISALLLHLEDERFKGLQPVLNHLSIATASARTHEEARGWLNRPDPPDVIFTDTTLPDGTWKDVLNAATKPSAPVKVIVVSPFDDHMLYALAMNAGAVDVIAPPFDLKDVAHVLAYAFKEPQINPTRGRHGIPGAYPRG